ncbi:unnamed protein product [Protopolystoma xenopodis]|uniref:DNA topoisomerase n=1 Tax=Protopolystoma xenopodis TaxID=117903 RepID=A0A448WUX6_9PLAT|nr:unnamed protein product [Protopolystoma xenopodis]
MKILNVAEKNDAAKNIATILSNNRMRRVNLVFYVFFQREGFSVYNKIYDFNFTFNGKATNMIMTSARAKIIYRQSCDPIVLFEAPVEKIIMKDYEPINKTLRREARYSDILIIWTDCDREGENIGFEIIEECKEVKPNIRVFRAKFSEITPSSIHHAIANLVSPDPLANEAVNARQELDLRIGAAFTRFQTLRLRRVFPQILANQLISYGSCQFPTLGFVVDRFKEVDRFVSEPFWRIIGAVTGVR